MPKLTDPLKGLAQISEAGPTGALTESTSGKPGRFLLKLIDVGVGSSGVYSEDTLRLAEADQVFRAGLHCYIDHAAALRRGPGGERSVRDLAAVLAEDAHYDSASKALVAEADIFGAEADRLRELAPHIGMSISASAIMGPPPAGQSKPAVRRLIEAESVDFVVQAGRGGAVLAVLESAAVEATVQDRRDQLDRAVRIAYADPRQEIWAGLRDFDPDTKTAYLYIGDTLYSQPYEASADDTSVALTGQPAEVRAVTTYVPVTSTVGATEADHTKEDPVSDITQAELDAVKAQAEAAAKRAEEAEARLAKAEQASQIAEAKKAAAAKTAAACQGMPPEMAARVAATVDAQVTEAALPADLDTRITAAVEAEKAYLKAVAEGQGRLVGFGATESTTTAPKRTRNAFGRPIQQEA